MAWSTPVIHSVGDVLTASDWNITSNDLSFLAGTAYARVATQQTTTSTTFTDLGTVGPTVTLTTGANALVILTAQSFNATSTDATFMGFAVSGATTLAASFSSDLVMNVQMAMSAVLPVTLTAGSNTFTAKYAVNGSTGTWLNRTIAVVPLP